MTTTPGNPVPSKPLIVAPSIGLPAKPPSASPPSANPLSQYLTTSTAKTCILIYGEPSTGKSRGAGTFPNPIWIDIDHNLPAGTPNTIPIWNEAFVDKVIARKHIAIANRTGALMKILQDLVRHAPMDSTIIVDTLSRLENYYDMQENIEPQPMSKKTNEVDGFELFRRRLDYFNGICLLLSSAGPNAIVIAHEQRERNDKGDLTQKIKTSLKGQMGDKLPGHFNTVLQAVKRSGKDAAGKDVIRYDWRCVPGLNEPARLGTCTEQFLPQDYNAIKKYLT